MINLVISGVTYPFPQDRDSPGWGADVTDWAIAVTAALTSVANPGDIPQTPGSIVNTGVLTSVGSLSFDTSTVRGAVIDYTIDRSTSTTELSETGTMWVTYNSRLNTWELARVSVGNAGVVFTITPAGQVQYTGTVMSGTGYVGAIAYQAKALDQ